LPTNKSKSEPQEKQAFVESHLALITLIASIIPSTLLLGSLWFFDVSTYLLGIVAIFLIFLTIYCVSAVWRKSEYQFRSLHNLLDAIVNGDYSFRGLAHSKHHGFNELINTINALAATLQKQRLRSEESQLLLQKVVDQIDVAIIAWDQGNQLQLINPAARALLDVSQNPNTELGNQLAELSLPQSLAFTNTMSVGETLVKNLDFKGNRGRYRLHMERFITAGDTRNLLFLTNISNILRHEEKRAWRNLVRVLSHEINNSLTPLKSLSDTLRKQVQKREQDIALKKELIDGMSIIGNRAESLGAFVQSYYKIARLPKPKKLPSDLKEIIDNMIKLFPDEEIHATGESITLSIDAAQIEQVLINLIKNAVESNASYAAKNDGIRGPVVLHWDVEPSEVILNIRDAGEGIQNQENLFTPFYTTKADGSGIGLVFCQQVIESHDGYLSIMNRADQHGCVVTIELPIDV